MKHHITCPFTSILLITFSIFLLFQNQVFAQDISAKIDELLQRYNNYGQFDGAVLVAEDGKVIFKKGYGYANREWDILNEPDTKFRIGSITKQITAMAIMILQEKGKLHTHDSICKYIPNCPTAWKDITIHHLLTHTSGIENFQDFPDNLQYNDSQRPLKTLLPVLRTKS